jgi:hypothetical protein
VGNLTLLIDIPSVDVHRSTSIDEHTSINIPTLSLQKNAGRRMGQPCISLAQKPTDRSVKIRIVMIFVEFAPILNSAPRNNLELDF